MAAKKTAAKAVEGRDDRKARRSRPIRLDDLRPDADIRGGSTKAIVFGQRSAAWRPKQ
jgi:hypothetical protein